jgi:hypothetical protein
MIFTHLLNVLNALQRLSRYVGLPEEAEVPHPLSPWCFGALVLSSHAIPCHAQSRAQAMQLCLEAAEDMPNDFSVLKRAKIRRGELVPLQMRAEAVLVMGVR